MPFISGLVTSEVGEFPVVSFLVVLSMFPSPSLLLALRSVVLAHESVDFACSHSGFDFAFSSDVGLFSTSFFSLTEF